MQILFVENHETFARTVSSLFLRDHDVVISPSLASVMETIANEQFDAALIDYDLDDCKGDEVVRLLRDGGFCGAILAVSSHDAGNAKLLAAGADASCPKLAFGRIAAILDGAVQARRRVQSTLDQFRALDAEVDWPFFDRDHGLSPALRAEIRPLTRSAAVELWQREVSSDPMQRHVMRLPGDHWVNPKQPGPNWQAEWERAEGTAVCTFLQAHFNVPPHAPVFFMLMRERAYQAPIGLLAAHWRAFLALDDEGPLILHSASGRYALFGPNGYLCADRRQSLNPSLP